MSNVIAQIKKYNNAYPIKVTLVAIILSKHNEARAQLADFRTSLFDDSISFNKMLVPPHKSKYCISFGSVIKATAAKAALF